MKVIFNNGTMEINNDSSEKKKEIAWLIENQTLGEKKVRS